MDDMLGAYLFHSTLFRSPFALPQSCTDRRLWRNWILTLAHSPGRFLVEQMLKMLMAYMLMHYDVEYLPARPANFVLGPINVPPPGATVKVRRKEIEAK